MLSDLENAKKWSEITYTCGLYRPDSGEREFFSGKVAFESGDTAAAKKYFDTANTKSKGRCFEDEDKKYLKFLKKGK